MNYKLTIYIFKKDAHLLYSIVDDSVYQSDSKKKSIEV